MNLSEFSKLTLVNANEAKNFISFLLGYGFKGTKLEDNQKAILGLFESFPPDFKTDISVWEPTFLKFFNKYSINEENLPYYNQYIISKANKTKIISKNPNWKWEEDKFEYSSLVDIIKGFEGISNNINNVYEAKKSFINKNKESFEKHIIGNKKAEKYLIDKKFFNFFLNNNYHDFVDFCTAFKFDHVAVFEKFIIKYYSKEGIGGYLKSPPYQSSFLDESQDLISVLHDLKDNDLLKIPKFTGNFDINKECENHVAIVFSYFVANKKFESAQILYKYFEKEILQGLNIFAKLDPKKITKTHIIGWDDPPKTEFSLEFLSEAARAMEDTKNNTNYSVGGIMKNHLVAFMDYFSSNQLAEKLENKLQPKEDIKIRKKL